MAATNNNDIEFSYVFLDVSIDSKPAGRIILRLFKKDLPVTSRNFAELASGVHGFGFRGTIFHRAIPTFMIQGGDFINHDGTGGRSIYGPRFRDENFLHKHTRAGLLSMANTGPHSNSSQFFITTNRASHLDNKHVVFGDVFEGMDVVQAIERCGSPSGRVNPVCKVEGCGVLDIMPGQPE